MEVSAWLSVRNSPARAVRGAQNTTACRGGVQADTPSDDLRQAVQVPEFQVDINLNRGEFSHTVYTTDLSPEYVDFNRSEYAYWNQAKADGLTR